MIIGTGLDIIEIARFERMDNAHFMERVFTLAEREYIKGKNPQTAAGLFAAKEAVVKALGTGFRGFWPCEVEIRHDALGRPFAVLHNKAALLAKRKHISRIFISISHHQTLAAAMAAAEGDVIYARRYSRSNARRRGGGYS